MHVITALEGKRISLASGEGKVSRGLHGRLSKRLKNEMVFRIGISNLFPLFAWEWLWRAAEVPVQPQTLTDFILSSVCQLDQLGWPDALLLSHKEALEMGSKST